MWCDAMRCDAIGYAAVQCKAMRCDGMGWDVLCPVEVPWSDRTKLLPCNKSGHVWERVRKCTRRGPEPGHARGVGCGCVCVCVGWGEVFGVEGGLKGIGCGGRLLCTTVLPLFE